MGHRNLQSDNREYVSGFKNPGTDSRNGGAGHTACNLGLPAGGIRRPHPRPDIGWTRVREPLVVTRHPTPRTPRMKIDGNLGRFDEGRYVKMEGLSRQFKILEVDMRKSVKAFLVLGAIIFCAPFSFADLRDANISLVIDGIFGKKFSPKNMKDLYAIRCKVSSSIEIQRTKIIASIHKMEYLKEATLETNTHTARRDIQLPKYGERNMVKKIVEIDGNRNAYFWAVWDGKDESGNYVENDTYVFLLHAVGYPEDTSDSGISRSLLSNIFVQNEKTK